jgi:hypothetical protein
MSLETLGQTLQSMDIATALRESALVYPIVMTGHLAGMALFGGMIFMTDLRLLGVGMKGYTITETVKSLRPFKHLGILLVAGCGFFLAWAKAEKYLGNPYFQIKMGLLLLIIAHAIYFRSAVYKNTEELDRAPQVPGKAKAAAILSLILWTGVVTAGRWIAYYEPPRPEASIEQRSSPVSAAVKPPVEKSRVE